MRLDFFRLLLCAAAAALTFTSALLAQSTSASLSGTVLDSSGGVVPGAGVSAVQVATGVASRTVTNDSGQYSFPSLTAGTYQLSAEKPGFRKTSVNNVLLEVGGRTFLDITLELGQTTEIVEVTADADNPLNYVNSSLGGTITERKVLDLPVSSRNVLNLTTTQAGTVGANFNGARRGNLNIQIDGINVMDARINQGVNSMIFASVDRIAEFRVLTQPIDAEFGRGSGQVQMITRSGTNEYHGSVFEFHRNTVLNANSFFNNLNGTDPNTGKPISPREDLIRNQYGARAGGPVLKNRTFFHVLWEQQRIRRRDNVTTTVWTEMARRGLYRFFPGVQNGNLNAARPTVDVNGNPVSPTGAALSTVSLFGLDPQRPGMDPTGLVKKYIDAMPLPNNFRFGDGLNTAGYTWIRPYKFDENNVNIKVDHILASAHRLSFSASLERNDEINDFMPQVYPGIGQDLNQQRDELYQLTLTSLITPRVVNEFRAGALRPLYRFYTPWEVDPSILPKAGATPFVVDFLTITDPVNQSNDAQGRISPNYQYFNKTSMSLGRHNVKFGGQLWFVSTNGFNSFTVVPRAIVGAGGVPVTGVGSIPGIGQNQTGAQNLLNDLNGSLNNLSQALNSPGGANPVFLPGEVKQRTWREKEFALFFQDDWKVSKSFTLNLGLRYEFYGVPYDRNGKTAALAGGSEAIFGVSGKTFGDLFQPGLNRGALTNILLVGGGSPNPSLPLYKSDLNNFAPAVGLAWELPRFARSVGDGRTVLRAGYSMAYERLSLRLLDVVSGDQPGLRQVADFRSANKLDLSNARLPLSPTGAPLETVPMTDRTQTVRTYDTGLRVPMIHNFNVSLQRSMPKNGSFSIAWVGSKGTRLLRGADMNEVNIFENGLLEAFNITQAGGNAALFDRMFMGLNVPGRGVVNGTTLTGSQVLRDINTTTQGYFASNSVGTLGTFLSGNNYLTGSNGGLLRNGRLPENFFRANPQFASARLFGNLSSSTYHSLQVEYLQRLRSLQIQWNYTFAKALGDEDGDAQEQNDSFRTQRNRSLDKRLLASSLQHVMRTNAIWELPFGPGKPWAHSGSWVRHLVGGWQVGVIFNAFSGDPLGFTSAAATFNSWTDNTPVAHAPVDPRMGRAQVTGNGVVYFEGLTQTPDPIIATMSNQAVRSRSTLRAIRAGDASGPLLLSNPGAGVLGTMNQRAIFGPGYFRFDANVIKRVQITERISFQFDAILENASNTPQWDNPVLDINNLNFGRITTGFGSRIVVLGGRINF
jgi:hypothetical protein